MASIFRGTDTRTGARSPSKFPIRPWKKIPLLVHRFRREEEIGKDLDHPVGDEGVQRRTPQQALYGYGVGGWAVAARVMRGTEKMPVARAIRIALGICNALEYIHSRGVVHRDLKPENIMIDADDRVKLIDFGIAGKAGASRLTFRRLSDIMGTPDYISPEQVEGSRGDARSDIYALGVILYEMLTRQTPFFGPNAFAVMNDRLQNNPVPPRQIEPTVTPQLQEIVYRAMERDPRNRYASAHEFAADLENPDQVETSERPELRDWRWRRPSLMKRVLTYSVLALVPLAIFTLLVYVARHA